MLRFENSPSVARSVGIAWTWRTLAEALGGTAARYRAAAPVLVLALVPLGLNWSWASRAGDYAARDWAYDLLMSVEPYAVLFTNGDNDTFPLWYMQEVEGVRKDVTVIVGMYLNTSWYPKQLQELSSPERQRPFDPGLAPGLYEDRTPPSGSILAVPAGLHDPIEQQMVLLSGAPEAAARLHEFVLTGPGNTIIRACGYETEPTP